MWFYKVIENIPSDCTRRTQSIGRRRQRYPCWNISVRRIRRNRCCSSFRSRACRGTCTWRVQLWSVVFYISFSSYRVYWSTSCPRVPPSSYPPHFSPHPHPSNRSWHWTSPHPPRRYRYRTCSHRGYCRSCPPPLPRGFLRCCCCGARCSGRGSCSCGRRTGTRSITVRSVRGWCRWGGGQRLGWRGGRLWAWGRSRPI